MGDKDIDNNVFDGVEHHGKLNATLQVTHVVARRVYDLVNGTSDISIPVPPPIDPVTSSTSTADAVARITEQLQYSLALIQQVK